jgi:hypothetical protein
MATTYTSTITIDAWKEHTCVGCGGTYRYRFQRKKSGQGGSPDAASTNAQRAVMTAIAKEVDMQPCPTCGLYQPDMVGGRKAFYHGMITLAASVCVLVPMIIYAADGISSVAAPWLIAALCSILVVIHWLSDFINPNSNLKSNRQLAKARIRDGVIRVPADVVQGVERDERAGVPSWTWAHTLSYLLMFVGLIAFVSPEFYRAGAGLRQNPGWHPLFAGNGDQPYVYFPDTITSVKGYWSASPTIRVANWQELGLRSDILQGSSHTASWGADGKITISSKESKTSSPTLWLRVHLPQEPRLEGKELDLQMSLNVSYPQMQGADSWVPATMQTRVLSKKLILSSPNCGNRYRAIWWGSYLIGTFQILFGSILLCIVSAGLRARALPTSVFFPEDEESQRPPRAAPPAREKDQRVRREKPEDRGDDNTYGIREDD